VGALRGRGVKWISEQLNRVAVQGPPTLAEMQIFTDAARRVRGVRVCSQHVHKSYIHTHTRACTMAKCVCVCQHMQAHVPLIFLHTHKVTAKLATRAHLYKPLHWMHVPTCIQQFPCRRASYIHTHTRACSMAKCGCVSTYASPCASYFCRRACYMHVCIHVGMLMHWMPSVTWRYPLCGQACYVRACVVACMYMYISMHVCMQECMHVGLFLL
jgi:hypothetical protein